MSWTLNREALDEVEGLVARAGSGATTLQRKVAPDPKIDLELCRMVKRLIPDGFLWADANGGYDEATALEVAPDWRTSACRCWSSPCRPTGWPDIAGSGNRRRCRSSWTKGSCRWSSCASSQAGPARWRGHEARRVRRAGRGASADRVPEAERGLMFLGSGLTEPDRSLAASLRTVRRLRSEIPRGDQWPPVPGGRCCTRP